MLLDTEPRIALFAATGGDDKSKTGVSITPYMLAPGEEQIIADRLHALLSHPSPASAAEPAAPAVDLTGRWEVQIEYAAGASTHTFELRQRQHDLEGVHRGEFVSRDLSGTIHGDAVRIRSVYGEQHGDALSFAFSGKVVGEEMSGALDMGEYLTARWTATRRARG